MWHRNSYWGLVGKSERKRPLGKPKERNRMILKCVLNVMGTRGLD
jgi:hypothetical protein